MKTYTLGFIFDAAMRRVVLVEKKRPQWQVNKLNGLGGKIEQGEGSAACIVREVFEEAGFPSKESDWTHVALLQGPDWMMDVYALVHDGDEHAAHTTTDEHVGWYSVAALPDNVLSNVPWLAHLAMDKLKDGARNGAIIECVVTYENVD